MGILGGMDNRELLRRRLHNQHLTRASTNDPGAEVAWLGAVGEVVTTSVVRLGVGAGRND